MLRYFIFIEYGLLPDLRVGVLISASQMVRVSQRVFLLLSTVRKMVQRPLLQTFLLTT